ncbi:MAG: WYL domain-containing protein, partial [Anaerolineae bacterium]|nr:WYL domain-containing protein [Anaerolineae bacterium]
DGLSTLAFLYNTFQPDAPAANQVRSLLDTLLSYLPQEQLQAVQRQRTILNLELRELDEGDIDPRVLGAVQRAVRQRQLLEFDYLSPRHDPPVPRQHTVEPYDFVFRQGHYYLEGYCLRWKGPLGEKDHAGHFSYRLAYMQSESIGVLPSKLPPGPRRARRYRLRYELAPRIARGDVSQHFEEMTVVRRDDGWAEVTASITDPFAAAKRLLHYGQHCRVLEPPEVVRLIRDEVRGMMELYEIGENS